MSPRTAAVLRSASGALSLREHLITTAARLIDERGTAGLTVRAIARDAQVADGVLYNHFADKEELLAEALAVHVAEVTRLGHELLRPGHGTVEENLRAFITHGLFVLKRVMPAFAGLMSQPGVLARFRRHVGLNGEFALPRMLAAYLRAEQETGRVARSADVDAAVTMIIGACHELVLPRLLTGVPAAEIVVPPRFAARVAATVVEGIGTGRAGGSSRL
jgi:AcrR family transcriptional regulator